jgi:hypothetical protein
MTITKRINKAITKVNANPIHSGDVTHHQDQSI